MKFFIISIFILYLNNFRISGSLMAACMTQEGFKADNNNNH